MNAARRQIDEKSTKAFTSFGIRLSCFSFVFRRISFPILDTKRISFVSRDNQEYFIWNILLYAQSFAPFVLTGTHYTCSLPGK